MRYSVVTVVGGCGNGGCGNGNGVIVSDDGEAKSKWR